MNEMRPPTRPNNLDTFWMPFTANRAFKAAPRLLARASGVHYTTDDGREILDGTAGLWCCNAGHGRREIIEAIQRQAEVMDFAPTFQIGHPIAFQAAARLGENLPAGLDRVFWTNSGSESADTALKIALAYHRARGDAGRVRLIGRERGYHGVGFGGITVGGIGPNRKQFGAFLPYADHLPHTHVPEHQAFSRGQPDWGAHLADVLENLVALHGAETIAAVMVEPVSGSAGVLVPPKGYLERLRAICDRHGILLIFDEVITGFGRLGTNFGAERLGVIPDIMTMAKGLTNAAVPMGAVAVRDSIYRAIVEENPPGGPTGIELFHGYTYSGHPLACAAAIAVLDLHRAEDLPGPRGGAGAVLAGRDPLAPRCAGRDRHTRPRPHGRDRAGTNARQADRPRATGVPPLLRRRAARAHDGRHHSPLAAADLRARARGPGRGDPRRGDPGGGGVARRELRPSAPSPPRTPRSTRVRASGAPRSRRAPLLAPRPSRPPRARDPGTPRRRRGRRWPR